LQDEAAAWHGVILRDGACGLERTHAIEIASGTRHKRAARLRRGHRQVLVVRGEKLVVEIGIGGFIGGEAVQAQLLGQAPLPGAKEAFHAAFSPQTGHIIC
jgi:hypothetical protein